MLVNELIQWDIVKKTWVVGERREHYAAETSIWKMISRVFRERELRWIRTAHEAFAAAGRELEAGSDERHQLIASRVAGLSQLAEVGAHLLQTMLEGEAVDSLPIKTVGELARAVRRTPGQDDAAAEPDQPPAGPSTGRGDPDPT
jgi:DNA-binding transcriptional regulator GbsR (MarR family)